MQSKFKWTGLYYGKIAHYGPFGTQVRWATICVITEERVILKKWFPGCGFRSEEKVYRGENCLDKAKKIGQKWVDKFYNHDYPKHTRFRSI